MRATPKLVGMRDSRHHVVALLRRSDFRRLYFTRVGSQFADGLFQASLAGTVLFNPEQQADPVAVAVGFAVLLLPYSLVGPFAGVLLDRWSRRNVLVVANLVRSALVPVAAALVWAGVLSTAFLLVALLIIGVNRFFLAGLSASLPHVAPTEHLVTGNSLSTTSGTVAFAMGIGGAVGLRELTGTGDHGYALVAVSSVLFYLASALLARGFSRDELGPDAAERSLQPRLAAALADVARGMATGVRHLTQRRVAAYALLAISANRVFYGMSTIATLLLYRNFFLDPGGLFPGQEFGLGQVVIASAVGAFLAAAITPAVVRRIPGWVWVTSLLVLLTVVQVTLGLPYTTEALVPAAMLVALASQGMKIVTDTAVQTECDDAYRGRIFSVYDTLYNVCLVGGLVLGALVLPPNGKSYGVLAFIAVGYLAVAAWYGPASSRLARHHRSPALDPA